MTASVLAPMRPEAYAAFLEAAIAHYAEDNVAAGRWSAAEAPERSRAAFAAILPQGLATPDVHVFEIMDEAGTAVVGSLVFAVAGKGSERSAFVYDLFVAPPFRRQGNATRAFAAMEAKVRELRLPAVGLHVFADNAGAQALYRKLGYKVAGLNMLKRLQL